MDPNHPNYYSNPQFYGDFQNLLNSQSAENSHFSPNLNQMPIMPHHETSQSISRNLFDDSQPSNKNTEKSAKWETKEDIALMAAWCHVSLDPIHGKNKKKSSMWAQISKIYEQTRAENPNEIGPRNVNQMKGRYKRLSESASKWVSAYQIAYNNKTSGMSLKDVEINAHKIYEGDGTKFLDLIVYNEVMCKYPKWQVNLKGDNRRSHPEDDDLNEESGGSTKRSRTTEEGDYVIHANQETPNSGSATIQRPIGREAAKDKAKGKASQSSSYHNDQFVEEMRALRFARESEVEVMKERIQIDKKREEMEMKREERKTRKMYLDRLFALIEKGHLTPEEEALKCNLQEWLNGK